MKAQAENASNEKLRKNLKQLFKNNKTKFDDGTNGTVLKPKISRKRPLGSEASTQAGANLIKNSGQSTKTIPKKKKRKLEQTKVAQKLEVSSKPKKKTKVKTKLSPPESNDDNKESKRNQLTKTPKHKLTSKQATSSKNKAQSNLTLIHHNEVEDSDNNSDESEYDGDKYFEADYTEERSSDEDNDYFGSSYSDDDYSIESERNQLTKTPKHKLTSKQATSPKNKAQSNLHLVLHNAVEDSDGSEYDGDECDVAAYDEEGSSDEDDDYFGSSYSDDDYSIESDEYFEDSDGPDYEDSDYSDYCDYKNSFLNGSDCYTGSDPDYELPENVPEDLIIHKGTAQKHDLNIEDNIQFDSDDDEPQIIEMSMESKIQEIRQPEAYAKSELLKLNFKSVNIIINHLDKCADTDTEKECPALVPIVDDDGFQLYNSESDSSSYEELSDSSIEEEDINLKYTQSKQDCDSDCEQTTNRMMKTQKQRFGVGIINVKNCKPQKQELNEFYINNEVETTAADAAISVDEMQTQIAEPQIITVSICDNTRQTSEIFDDKLANNNHNVVRSPTLESVSQNTTAIQPTQAENKEIDIDDYADCSLSSSLETKNDVPSPINEIAQKTPKAAKESLTTRTIFINAVNSNVVLVLVKEPFYLYGTVCMTLLAGNVEVYGYKPRLNEEFEIFSPRGCSTVQITNIPTATQSKTGGKIADTLKPFLSSFSSLDLQRIENGFVSGQDAVLLLNRNIRRKKIKKIFKNYMNENVFPNMNSIQRDGPAYACEYQLDCVINMEAERCLKVPQEWQSFAFTTTSKILLAGGKSVGKSTLLRYLLNTQLEYYKQVLVIDLDIGQAELFVPQSVSCTVLNQPLLGPGFFLNHQPTRAYVVGHSNIVLCAHTYMRAVKKLIDFCYSKEEFSQMPWLINTMGYNKGFGMELMSVLAQLIKPTDIIQLQSNKEINNFDDLLHPHVLASTPRLIYTDALLNGDKDKSMILEYKLHVLSSAILQESRYQRDWEMSAKDFRYATFLSRLSDVLQGNAEWLTDCVPLSASIKELHLVNMACSESTREDLVHAIEANLVYLCRREEDNSDPLECFGIGIVRCIDLEKVYLLPAMPYENLNKVNCLALGEMPLPTSLFTNQGPKVRNMAAFLYNTVDARTSKSIKQIYHRPAHFLQGKHKDVLNN